METVISNGALRVRERAHLLVDITYLIGGCPRRIPLFFNQTCSIVLTKVPGYF